MLIDECDGPYVGLIVSSSAFYYVDLGCWMVESWMVVILLMADEISRQGLHKQMHLGIMTYVVDDCWYAVGWRYV